MKLEYIKRQIKNTLINKLTNKENLLFGSHMAFSEVKKKYGTYKYNDIESILIYATKKKHLEIIKTIKEKGYDFKDIAHELIVQGIYTHSSEEIKYLLKIDDLTPQKIKRYMDGLLISPNCYNGYLQEFKILFPFIVQYRQDVIKSDNHPLAQEINDMIEYTKINSSDYAINIKYINETCRGLIEAISESSPKLSNQLLHFIMIKGHFELLEEILNNSPKKEKCNIEGLILNAAHEIKKLMDYGIVRSLLNSRTMLPEEYFKRSIFILLKNYERASSQSKDFSEKLISILAQTNQDDLLKEILLDNYFSPIEEQTKTIRKIFLIACKYCSFDVINSISDKKELSAEDLQLGLEILVSQEEDSIKKKDQMKCIECIVMISNNVHVSKENIKNPNLVEAILNLVGKKKLEQKLNMELEIQQNKSLMKI